MFKLIQISTGYTDGSVEKRIIEAAGGEHVLMKSEEENDIIETAKDADGLLVAMTQVTKKIIDSIPKLKIIVRAGIGVDNIDLEAAKARGVRVFNLPTYCQDEVADHTVAMLLAIERKIVDQINDIKAGSWRAPSRYAPVYGLKDKTVALIGCGGIAQKVIERLRPFGLHFITYDPFLSKERAAELGVKLVTLYELYKEADFITLHTPYTPDTHHMIDKSAFEKMKPGVYIINTARGPLIDTDALYEAIKNKRISGAALDVVEGDLDGARRFTEFKNVIITPHTAYYSDIANSNIKTQAGEVIAKYIRGEEQRSLV